MNPSTSLKTGAGLTQVLSDGTNTYLYGNGRISQHTTQTEYFLADALGSVRQLADTAGTVTLTQSYSPYGETVSSTGGGTSAYQFTGEMRDSYIKLIYLRSRYYAPETGRFLTKDSWQGDYNRPLSLNQWNYVEGNPVNFTDPSGHFNNQYDTWNNQDPRDLTYWLYREIIANVKDPRLLSIKDTNSAGNTGLGLGVGMIGGGLLCGFPLVSIGGVMPIVASGGAYLFAGSSFMSLVKDHATWDFKHEIKKRLGTGITLCAGSNCQNDIEYSVPGNIHYGFVARQAGYMPSMTNAGVGVAEVIDPAHDPDRASRVGVEHVPYDGTWGLESGPLGISFNFGNNPKDHQAVELGIRMFNQYGVDMTYSEFLSTLQSGISSLDRHSPYPNSVSPEIAKKWPYPVGFFDPTK